MKILYVEDNPANLSLLQRIARMGGHQVISYTDGESALTGFEKDKPDLVLMDVQLSGGLTGLDVVRQLRARGHKTPIVAVTAYAMTGDRERCIEAGCDTYIAKPLPVTELVELVQKYEAQLKAGPLIKPLTGTASTPPVRPETAPVSETPVAPFTVEIGGEGQAPDAKAEGDTGTVKPADDKTEADRPALNDANRDARIVDKPSAPVK